MVQLQKLYIGLNLALIVLIVLISILFCPLQYLQTSCRHLLNYCVGRKLSFINSRLIYFVLDQLFLRIPHLKTQCYCKNSTRFRSAWFVME